MMIPIQYGRSHPDNAIYEQAKCRLVLTMASGGEGGVELVLSPRICRVADYLSDSEADWDICEAHSPHARSM